MTEIDEEERALSCQKKRTKMEKSDKDTTCVAHSNLVMS